MVAWSSVYKDRWFLSFLFGGAFVLRLILFFGFVQHDKHFLLDFDSDQYRHIAHAIVDGKGFVTSDDKPTAYRLPGYPLYLAACYHDFPEHEKGAMLLQLFLSCLIPLLMFLFALALFPENILMARFAGLGAALHPGLMLYAGILSTETLFILFFLLFLILFFSVFCKKIKNNNYWLSLLFSGFFLGIASLFRAVGPYVLVMGLFFLVIHFWKNKKYIVAGCLYFTTGWLLPVSAWLVRNVIVFGALFLHTLPGLHFLQYSAVYVVMENQKCDYFQARNHLFDKWHNHVVQQENVLGRNLNEYEYYKEAETVAFSTLLHNPKLALKHAFIQIMRTCGTLYSTLYLYVKPGTVYGDDASLWFKIKLYLCPNLHKPFLVAFIYEELLYSLWLLLGVLMGIFLMFKRRRQLCLMLLTFVSTLIVMTLAYGCARLRMPADLFFIVFAVYGWMVGRSNL